jgi:hypothetical protein
MKTAPVKDPKALLGYFDGMNYYAHKQLAPKHEPYPYGKNTVIVKKDMSKRDFNHVERHEKTEVELMKHGKSYREAHSTTLLRLGDYKQKAAALRDADRNIAAARRYRNR